MMTLPKYIINIITSSLKTIDVSVTGFTKSGATCSVTYALSNDIDLTKYVPVAITGFRMAGTSGAGQANIHRAYFLGNNAYVAFQSDADATAVKDWVVHLYVTCIEK